MKKQIYVIMNSNDRFYMGIYNGYPQFGIKYNAVQHTYEEAQRKVELLESEGYPCYVEALED